MSVMKLICITNRFGNTVVDDLKVGSEYTVAGEYIHRNLLGKNRRYFYLKELGSDYCYIECLFAPTDGPDEIILAMERESAWTKPKTVSV